MLLLLLLLQDKVLGKSSGQGGADAPGATGLGGALTPAPIGAGGPSTATQNLDRWVGETALVM
jgi:hypothetical protein